MPFMTKVLRVVTEGEQVGGSTVAQPVRLVGADGGDVELGGGDAPTSIPQGALLSGDGIALERDADTHVITVSVKAGSIGTEQLKAGAVNTSALLDGAVTEAKIAAGVIPAAYTLPAATGEALGGVRQAAAVAAVAADDSAPSAAAPTKAEFDKVVAEANETKKQLNALLAALKASGATA